MTTVDEHRSRAGAAALQFAVLVVSTSRTLDDDRSGARILELVEEAGHASTGRALVPDDVDAIRGAVRGAGAQVIVLTGGTGLAPLDVTPEAVEPLFSRRLDGFGELFRMLSWQQVGAAAMLSRATAGLMPDGRVVFALPGSVRACELAMRELVLPEIRHLVSLAAPSSRVSEADPPQTEGQGYLAVTEFAGPVPTPEQKEPLPQGWMRAVQELGGEVLGGLRVPLPEPLARVDPVRNLLDTAGETGVLRIGSRRHALYGWPDLRRPSSKVLAVGPGGTLGEVVALHRRAPTGTCVDHGLLTLEGAMVEVAERITGAAPDRADGRLFAVSGEAVWIERDGRVLRFDGRSERDEGTPTQALATLVLDWHAR